MPTSHETNFPRVIAEVIALAAGFIRTGAACFALTLAFVLLAITPAMASKWPGAGASPGAAMAAKVIGERCPGVLSATEIGELEAYLAKWAAEEEKEQEAKKSRDSTYQPFSFEEFRKRLTEDYAKKYRDPKNCNADAVEEARDILERVRKEMASGKPLHAADSDLGLRRVIMAKVTGEQCESTLTALELAELELYIAKYWVWFAKTATDHDTRYTMQLYKKEARDFESSKDCNPKRIAEVKDIAARVRKSEDGKAQ